MSDTTTLEAKLLARIKPLMGPDARNTPELQAKVREACAEVLREELAAVSVPPKLVDMLVALVMARTT